MAATPLVVTPLTMAEPIYFASPQDFRQWLETHAANANELLVGFHKVDSGQPSMSWSESVDEALCFGWIDGVRKRVDDLRYTIRFTPHKATSIWSAINIAKFEQLSAAGRMTQAGAQAFSQRSEARSRVYSHEQPQTATLAPNEIAHFQHRAAAWKFFEATPAGYRKVMLHWITSAKRPETRSARLEQLIQACADGRRLR